MPADTDPATTETQEIAPEEAGSTALGVACMRALGAMEADPAIRNPDHLAIEFVDRDYPMYPHSDEQATELRQYLESAFPGTYHMHTARTLHIDALTRAAIDHGIEQVVLLGAGFDSRAYRFRDSAPGVRFFELDLPELQEQKTAKVASLLDSLPDHVTYVPIDFNSQPVHEALRDAGHDATQPTFFNWEGVTYFLEASGVDATLASIAARSASGSEVVFDYPPRSVIQGQHGYGTRQAMEYVAQMGEPWTFGLEPTAVDEFLTQRGFEVRSNFGPADLEQAYLMRSDGAPHGRVAEYIWIVHAAVG